MLSYAENRLEGPLDPPLKVSNEWLSYDRPGPLAVRRGEPHTIGPT